MFTQSGVYQTDSISFYSDLNRNPYYTRSDQCTSVAQRLAKDLEIDIIEYASQNSTRKVSTFREAVYLFSKPFCNDFFVEREKETITAILGQSRLNYNYHSLFQNINLFFGQCSIFNCKRKMSVNNKSTILEKIQSIV